METGTQKLINAIRAQDKQKIITGIDVDKNFITLTTKPGKHAPYLRSILRPIEDKFFEWNFDEDQIEMLSPTEYQIMSIYYDSGRENPEDAIGKAEYYHDMPESKHHKLNKFCSILEKHFSKPTLLPGEPGYDEMMFPKEDSIQRYARKCIQGMGDLRGGISFQNAAGQLLTAIQAIYDEVNKRVNVKS